MKTIIPLHIRSIEEGNYHVFLRVKVGRYASNLLLDTGASKTVFDHQAILRFIRDKEIKEYDSQSVGLGSSGIKTEVAVIKNLRFGELKLKEFEVAVLDLSHVNHTYKQIKIEPIDGVLGSDFLMKYQAVINYKKAELQLWI